ncbi:MAG TPA: hypothetical protein DIT25_01295, partial [Candidatus Moranbacteria bacterium]|nr:hypothetical protein [Candidatus Moranbacteria bacterium]
MPKVIKKQNLIDAKELATQNVLTQMRHKSEEEEASAFAALINFPYIDTNLIPISNESLKSVTEEDSRKYSLAVIQKEGRKITLVSTDPTRAETAAYIQKLRDESGLDAKAFVISRHNMERIWEKYKNVVFTDILSQLSVTLTGDDLKKFDQYLKDLITLKQRINELPTTQILNVIMGGAYKLGASDIHIEPQENDFRLRYRIDGVLHDVAELPLSVFKSIISRIKMMSGMKINLRDIAQDGTFDVNIDSKKISIRVSIIPGNYGESVVMRLLDPASIQVNVENLGLRGLAYEEIQKQIAAPNGMVLTTGPTGSGK